MHHLWTIARRELASYFFRPMAYLVLLGFQLVAMLDFSQLVESLSDVRRVASFSDQSNPLNQYLAGQWLFWVALLIAVPSLTMRLLAEEKRSGTLEGLLTAPVTESAVILGKWVAGFVMFLALLVPFGLYLFFLWKVGEFPIDLGPLLSIGCCLSTMGMMFVAIGIAMSAATRNQIESAIGTFVVMLGMLLITAINQLAEVGETWPEVILKLSIYVQLNEAATGKLDLRVLLLHLSVTIFALFLATKLLESRKGQ